MPEGYVYLIGNTFDGMYKIGFTEGAVEDRRKQLSTGSSQELTIVNYFKSNYPHKLEKYLHRIFKHYHHRGEWFLLSPDEVERFMMICEKAERNFEVLTENKNYFA